MSAPPRGGASGDLVPSDRQQLLDAAAAVVADALDRALHEQRVHDARERRERERGLAAALRDLADRLPRGVELWVGGPPLPDVVAAVHAAGGSWLADFDAYEERLLGLGARF